MRRLTLNDMRFVALSPYTIANAWRAESCVVRVDEKVADGNVSFSLNRLLNRLDSLSSVRIEGRSPTLKALVLFEALQDIAEAADTVPLSYFGQDDIDVRDSALEALRYVHALEHVYETIPLDVPFAPEHLLDIHSICVYDKPARDSGATFRKQGAQAFAEQRTSSPRARGEGRPPIGAIGDIPSPPDLALYLDDLCAFVNSELYTPNIQAAIAHFQFEGIKPFKTGMDKTGRLLCHYILHRRGLTKNFIPPIGLAPATRPKEHAKALLSYRYRADDGQGGYSECLNNWVNWCSWSSEYASAIAEKYLSALITLRKVWTEKAGMPKKGSAMEMLFGILPGSPVITVKYLQAVTGRSVSSLNEAVNHLLKANVLAEVPSISRSRVFAATDAMDLFDRMDKMAVPAQPVSRDSFFAKR